MTGFLLKAVDVFPHLKGAIMSISYVLMSLLAVRKIYWSQVFFDDTIIPTSTIIFVGAVIVTILFSIVSYKKRSRSLLNIT